MKIKETIKYISGSLVAAMLLIITATMVVYPAVDQVIGLAVVGSADGTQWNNIKDIGIQTDGVTSGSLTTGLMGFNGASFDRLRSSIPNGLQVDVTRISGTVTVIGNQADNTANSTAKLPTIPCRANSAAQLWTEGNQVPCSTDLSGYTRSASAPVEGGTVLNSRAVSVANTANVFTLTGAAGQRVHLYKVSARCAGGSSFLQVQDGATIIYDTDGGTITANGGVVSEFEWATGLTGTTGNNMVVTIAACGTGNISAAAVEADRF